MRNGINDWLLTHKRNGFLTILGKLTNIIAAHRSVNGL